MMTSLPRSVIVLLITTSCVIFDQASKFVAKAYLGPGALISFAGDTFRLQYAENSGAFLSLGASLPDPWRNLVFTVLVGIFLFGLLGYVLFSRSLPAVAVNCLSFVFAGGISNLIDRIAYDGRVVDFLNVGFGPLRTGIFNVADMAITFGALILAVDTYRQKDPSETVVRN
jgi:signal peptidase II